MNLDRDIIMLAESMISKSLEFRSHERASWFRCIYCGDIYYDEKGVKHRPYCPILIAKRFLDSI